MHSPFQEIATDASGENRNATRRHRYRLEYFLAVRAHQTVQSLCVGTARLSRDAGNDMGRGRPTASAHHSGSPLLPEDIKERE